MPSPAEDLHQRGLVMSNRRRYEQARRLLAKAAQAADDPDLRARIDGTLAYVLAQTGNPAEAERLCRAALAVEGLTGHTRGVLAGQLGFVLGNHGRIAESLKWLGVAIDTIPDDPMAVANLRMNRSIFHMQRAALTESAADLEAAIAVFVEHGTPTDVAEARHNLGYVSLLQGDLLKAMQLMAKARTVIAAMSEANAAIGDMDHAEVLRDAGLVTEAEDLLQQAIAVFGQHRMSQSRGEAEFQLARSLLRHDALRAAAVAGSAATRFRRMGNSLWTARAEAVRLRARLATHLYDNAGHRSKSQGRLPPAGRIVRVAESLSAAGLRSEAVALRLDYQLSQARRGLPTGRLPRLPHSGSVEVRLLADEVRAVRAARSADTLRHAARGLDELDRSRTSFGSLDLQTSLAMHAGGLMLTGLEAAARSRRPEIVFEWSERARHLSLQVVPLRPPPDSAFAADLAHLRTLRTQHGDDWLSEPEVRTVADRLRRRQWSGTAAADLERRASLDEFQSSLGADTALLSYVFSPLGLTCLVVARDRVWLVDLPGWDAARNLLAGLAADLEMAVGAHSPAIAELARRTLDERLSALSERLLRDPLAKTDAERIVLTGPGVLAGLPWGMLPAMKGRAFTLAGSASHWLRGQPAGSTPKADGDVLTRTGFVVGPGVPRGEDEIRTAATAWAAPVVLRGGAVTADRISTLSAEVDLLHIAAHGRHAVDNPLFSGLELLDGTLFGYDIDRMSKVPQVVILSACEVGRSTVRWGEEAIGMTRSWLHAGAQCVIAAPVLVADDDACELLGGIHTGLASGRAPAVALAEASHALGIVAPFQCHGDGLAAARSG